jgi:hypothetical protein
MSIAPMLPTVVQSPRFLKQLPSVTCHAKFVTILNVVAANDLWSWTGTSRHDNGANDATRWSCRLCLVRIFLLHPS